MCLKFVQNTCADQMNTVHCEFVEFLKLFIVKYISWKIVLTPPIEIRDFLATNKFAWNATYLTALSRSNRYWFLLFLVTFKPSISWFWMVFRCFSMFFRGPSLIPITKHCKIYHIRDWEREKIGKLKFSSQNYLNCTDYYVFPMLPICFQIFKIGE